MVKYNFHEDAGHGWLEVPKKDIEKINLLNRLSSYSYINNDLIYLEEDFDAVIFVNKLKENNIFVELNYIYDGNTSKIRSYSRFRK
jgi:hypothetical protein